MLALGLLSFTRCGSPTSGTEDALGTSGGDAAAHLDAAQHPDAAPPGGADVGPLDAASGLDSGFLDAMANADATTDGGQPADGGMSPPDAAAGDAASWPFIEDFRNLNWVDMAGSDAVIDTSSTGYARAPAPRTLGSTGSGTTAFAPMAAMTLAPGSYDFASFDLDNVRVDVNGDLTLRVNGPFRLRNGNRANLLVVTGSFTLYAGGPVEIDDSVIAVQGNVFIQQPTTDGIVISGPSAVYGEITTSVQNPPPGAGSGSVQIWTRGALTLGANGYIDTGRVINTTGRAGSIEIRAYGDVTIGPHDAYLISSDSMGDNGGIAIFTEGRITLDTSSYLIAGRGNATGSRYGDIVLHSKGAIALIEQSYLISAPGGSVDLVSESTVSLQNSWIMTGNMGVPSNPPPGIHIEARSVVLGPSPATPSSGGNVYTNSAGPVTIDALENVSLLVQSYISNGPAVCAPGAGVTIRTEGEVSVRGQSGITGGRSGPGMGCAAMVGGPVTILAGTVTATIPNSVTGGPGVRTGTVTITATAGFVLGDLNAHLTGSSTVTSIAIGLSGALQGVRLFGAIPSGGSGARVLLSPSGAEADFLPARYQVGKSLTSAWRYRLLLEPRMFDASALDGFEVDAR
jgi:hypothetical protein